MERADLEAAELEADLVAPLLRAAAVAPAELGVALVAPFCRADVASPAAFEAQIEG